MANPNHNRAFEVTKDDITNGIARNSAFCPLAEVIQRNLPDARYILVDLALIRWSDPTKRKRYIFTTPTKAQQFIIDFDQGHHDRLRPFTLRLPSPIQIADMRTHRNRDRSQEYAKRKARKKPTVAIDSRGQAIKIGGNLPVDRHATGSHGNIQRLRKFGVRALIE